MNKEITLKNNIGYEKLETQFQKIVSLRKNQTWMLVGRKGIGKRTLSMRFAAFVINNFNSKWEETKLTDELFKKETDNLFYITSLDEKVSGKISKEQIDNLSSKFRLHSSNTNNRAIIIDKFNWLTMNAMNSMLKFLEEPPKGLYFFLIVDELTNVLPTIQSRSQKLFFQNHSFESCEKILNENTQSKQKEESKTDSSITYVFKLIEFGCFCFKNFAASVILTFLARSFGKYPFASKKDSHAKCCILPNTSGINSFPRKVPFNILFDIDFLITSSTISLSMKSCSCTNFCIDIGFVTAFNAPKTRPL